MYEYTPEESCWLYWKYYQKESKGIYIRRFKNFDKHREDATKWVCFEKLSIVARDYKINLHEYIPMVAKKFKGKYFHPKQLLNPSNLEMWSHRHKKAEALTNSNKVVEKTISSMKFIVKFCKENELKNLQEYLEESIKAEVLGLHIASSRLSKYFLSLLPPDVLKSIKYNIEPDIATILENTVINHREALRGNTVKAFVDVKGVELPSVSAVVNNNIKKILKK